MNKMFLENNQKDFMLYEYEVNVVRKVIEKWKK